MSIKKVNGNDAQLLQGSAKPAGDDRSANEEVPTIERLGMANGVLILSCLSTAMRTVAGVTMTVGHSAWLWKVMRRSLSLLKAPSWRGEVQSSMFAGMDVLSVPQPPRRPDVPVEG